MAELQLAASLRLLAMLACLPLAASGELRKRTRSEELAETLRMEPGCADNFPAKPKECPNDLWLRCCKQEVACHNYHCREVVMGRLSKGMQVRIREDFTADDESEESLKKGMKGRVLRVDEDGDALVKLFEDDLDDEGVRHWIYKTTFWDKLELPGKMERLRAWKAVSCLDECSIQQECRLASMSKKQSKAFQTCVQACNKLCANEHECQEPIALYAQCKQETSMKQVCNAPKASTEEL